MEKLINAIKEAAANPVGETQEEINLHTVLSECVVNGDIPSNLYTEIEEYVKKTA